MLFYAWVKIVPFLRRRVVGITRMEEQLNVSKSTIVHAAKLEKRTICHLNNMGQEISSLIQTVLMEREDGIYNACSGKWNRLKYQSTTILQQTS